jgi:hypothetical protein
MKLEMTGGEFSLAKLKGKTCVLYSRGQNKEPGVLLLGSC